MSWPFSILNGLALQGMSFHLVLRLLTTVAFNRLLINNIYLVIIYIQI